MLNPIRAKIVRSVRDWAWSSYRATSGQVDPPGLFTTDWLLSQFQAVAADTDPPRVADIDSNSQGTQPTAVFPAYRRFVRQGRGADIRNGLRAGSLLGGADFAEKMRPKLLDTPWIRMYSGANETQQNHPFGSSSLMCQTGQIGTHASTLPFTYITTNSTRLRIIWVFISQRSVSLRSVKPHGFESKAPTPS